MSARRDIYAGSEWNYGAPRSYQPDRLWQAQTSPVVRRILFWSAVVIPLLVIFLLGLFVDGATPATAMALVYQPLAPLVMLFIRAVSFTYFLPLIYSGASPNPIFAALFFYLLVGLILLALRKWKRAAVVLLLPLLCTIPLSVVDLRAADDQVSKVEQAFAGQVTEYWSQNGSTVTEIDYRFVTFDRSGSQATVAGIVTSADSATVSDPHHIVFKEDYAVQFTKSGSRDWYISQQKHDFHPGYEP